MYDFVTMLLFDEKSSVLIHALKEKLKNQGIMTGRKPWPPHITVDLFKDLTISTLIEKTDILTKNLLRFTVKIESFGDFYNRVLYLKPQRHDSFQMLKNTSDALLGSYSIEQNKRSYQPHITLAYGKTVYSAYEVLQSDFTPFEASILSFAVYSRQMVLQKEYLLATPAIAVK